MTSKILHLKREDREPDLYATDIPFSRTGLSRAVVVDRADAETYRTMVREALAMVAALTTKCRQYELVVAQLRAELRARRAA